MGWNTEGMKCNIGPPEEIERGGALRLDISTKEINKADKHVQQPTAYCKHHDRVSQSPWVSVSDTPLLCGVLWRWGDRHAGRHGDRDLGSAQSVLQDHRGQDGRPQWPPTFHLRPAVRMGRLWGPPVSSYWVGGSLFLLRSLYTTQKEKLCFMSKTRIVLGRGLCNLQESLWGS